MTNAASCPQCGSPLPEGILQGLCPRCLTREAGQILAAPGRTLEPPDPARLRYFGDYELLEEIAHGGMGVVWKARQISLNRIVAVKLLLAGKFSSPEFVQRFRAEAEAAANLQHPNIVAIHEVGEHEGQQYFSMDYVQGRNLAELAREQPLPGDRAATYLKTVTEAVHYAHQRGVLHRDLKPANILIDADDEPRVTDFGVAKRITSESEIQNSKSAMDLTLTGQVLGTPGFMSPEQAGGKRGVVSPASDVYSLGAVLYFLVTGRAPFAAGSLEETLRQIHETEPVSPRLLNPALPRDLETICLKSLSKEPARRYASAQALAEDLGRFLSDETIIARPARPPEKLWRWCRRKPALASAIAGLLLVGTAGLSGILWQWWRAERHAASETAQRQRAEHAVTMLELQRAEDLLEKDEVTMGVAYLARMVRQQPMNQITARRLLSALTQRNFALPVGAPMRHSKRVWHAEFSPDGRRIVTAGLDLHAAVWDARTGALLFGMRHREAVRTARFSPDGTRILTVADDSRARLWDANTGHALGQPMGHRYHIGRAPQFSPDGERVLTIQEDGAARLWDGHTGEPALEPLSHEGPINNAAFNSTGSHFATCSASGGTVRVWETHTGRLTGKLGHPVVWLVAFSPDGKRLVTAGGDFLMRVWEVSAGQLLNTVATPSDLRYEVVRFSPEGERILTALSSGAMQIWNPRDGTALTRPMLHRTTAWSAEFSPEGQRVFTASLDSTARLWDAATGEPLTAPLEHDDMVISGRLNPDGALAVTAGADGSARIWDIRPGAARSQLLPRAVIWAGARFSPDGEMIASSEEGKAARLWNARTLQPGPLLMDAPSVVHIICWSPDSRRVAAFCADRTTRLWDARTGAALIEPIRHETSITDLKFSPDGQWLATAGRDGNLSQWNIRTGEGRGKPIPNRDKIECFAYSPNGQLLLCSDFKDDQARLHDAASGRLLAQTPEREGRIMYADFSPDGQRIVTGSEDASVRIWRADTLQPLTEPLRHKSSVLWAEFSPDGHRVVTASEDGTARIWDAQSGQTIGEPLVHRGAVKVAEFSPDGLLIVTVSRNGIVRLWDPNTGRPVSEPFPHFGQAVSASFSPDGRRLLTVSHGDGPRSWDVPPIIRSAESALLADLAEAVMGKRIDDKGALESASSDRLTAIRQSVASLSRDADFTRWLEWFFADRSTRTISPYSQITIPQHVERLGHETNLHALREALQLNPSDSWIYSRLAVTYLKLAQTGDASAAAHADWASRQAIRLAPSGGPPWIARAEFHAQVRSWAQLLEETQREIAIRPDNAYLWQAHVRALQGLSRSDAMIEACTRGLQVQENDSRADVRAHEELRNDLLFMRAGAFKALGQLAQAAADNLSAHGLTPRDPQVGPDLIDLGLFYNGGRDQGFPVGIQRLAGTDFDFRGWIRLDLSLVRPGADHLPKRVDDIPIQRYCRRLHFLQTVSHASRISPGTNGVLEEKLDVAFGVSVGHYVIHYPDGQQAEVPIVYGRDVRDYFHSKDYLPDDPALVVAWTGSSKGSRRLGATTRLYKQTWENPRPDVPIRSLDFVHARTHAVPILIAITAEP